MMHKVLGWMGIIITYAIMIFMMVAGLEIMEGLRNTNLKISITTIIVATWIMGGFMAYMIHEYMKEETPR